METNAEHNESLILRQLMSGKRITSISVLKSVGTTEIRVYIARIRKTINVSDEWVQRNGKRFKEYFIIDTNSLQSNKAN